MIRQITLGKSYTYKGRRCVVISHTRRLHGWFPDSVEILYLDGQRENMLGSRFRDKAEQIEKL